MKDVKRRIPLFIVPICAALVITVAAVGWRERVRHVEACLTAHRRFLDSLIYLEGDAGYRYMSRDYQSSHSVDCHRLQAKMFEPLSRGPWHCIRYGRGRCWVGRRDSEGRVGGIVYEYSFENEQWKFTGNVRPYLR